MTTDIDRARSFDPARGSFCALSKAGKPMNSRRPAVSPPATVRGILAASGGRSATKAAA